jgi:hypothetical protein
MSSRTNLPVPTIATTRTRHPETSTVHVVVEVLI